MMRWLREHLLPREDDTEVDRAKFRQRQKVDRWESVYQSIFTSERGMVGERRRDNRGHTPERRHG
jgi:hypothetical protein